MQYQQIEEFKLEERSLHIRETLKVDPLQELNELQKKYSGNEEA